MSSVDFFYEGVPIAIQCDENDKMDEIVKLSKKMKHLPK